MERIAIVGYGLIGRGWAIVFARAGHQVVVHDADPTALERGMDAIEANLRELHEFGLIGEAPELVLARIAQATSLEDAIAGADYVQESVAEKLEVKREVFAAMDALAAPDTVLASSTSYIPTSAFSAGLSGRHRCLVVHPTHPVHLIPVVELSPAPWTAADVIERTSDLQRRVGQSPVVLRKEIEGFVFNRLQAALLGEAMTLWEAGYASADDIDRTVRDGVGLRWSFMGPFETFDLAAPGGVVDAGVRYGGAIGQIAANRVAADWTPELMARLEAERAEIQPRDALAARARWRDRRLMGLLAHKSRAAADDGS